MEEIELKFLVPETRRAGVLAALHRGQVTQERLQAHYFDTPDERLAQHRMALRVRKEGRRWVQTFKGATEDAMRRIEQNVTVSAPPRGAPPRVNLALHDAGPAGDALRKALNLNDGDAAESDSALLTCRYSTDIRRVSRIVRRGRSRIELAFDTGWIVAEAERAHVCELELELVSGSVEDLLDLAEQWVQAHGLAQSIVSKAERGALLARGQRHGRPEGAQELMSARDDTARHVGRKVVASCLHHVLRNTSELLAGSEAVEHVHQARVGLRRLRTALREFGVLLPPLAAGTSETLRHTFRQLGEVRDRTVVLPQWEQALRSAGAPKDAASDESGGALSGALTPANIVQQWPFQQALLDLMRVLALSAVDRSSPEESATGQQEPLRPPEHARHFIAVRLQRLHRRIARAAEQFAELPEQEQHRIRRQLKRLRYLGDFANGLFPKSRMRRYLSSLKDAQDALGLHMDQLVARHAYQSRMEASPHAAFAVGWLTARGDETGQRCAQALRAVTATKRYWKSGLSDKA